MAASKEMFLQRASDVLNNMRQQHRGRTVYLHDDDLDAPDDQLVTTTPPGIPIRVPGAVSGYDATTVLAAIQLSRPSWLDEQVMPISGLREEFIGLYGDTLRTAQHIGWVIDTLPGGSGSGWAVLSYADRILAFQISRDQVSFRFHNGTHGGYSNALVGGTVTELHSILRVVALAVWGDPGRYCSLV